MNTTRLIATFVVALGLAYASATIGQDKKNPPPAKDVDKNALLQKHDALASRATPFAVILAMDPDGGKLTAADCAVMATAAVGVTEGKGDEPRFVLTIEALDKDGKVVSTGKTEASIAPGKSKALVAGSGITQEVLKPGKYTIRARVNLKAPDGKLIEIVSKQGIATSE